MKFCAKDELGEFSFDDSGIEDFRIQDSCIEFTLNGAVVKARNSQNARFEDMYCGTIVLRLEDAQIVRLVKEGYRYYDAAGELKEEVPNEDVPAPAQAGVLQRIKRGIVFTIHEDEVEEGYAYEFGIDVPKPDDEEETDTFWLCIVFRHSVAAWDRFCSPVDAPPAS